MKHSFTIGPPPLESCAAVLANGPSLRGVDVTRLPATAAFGMNAAYRYWERIGWYPSHYACLDEVVGLSHAAAIEALIGRTDALRPRSFLLRANLIETLGPLGTARKVTNFDQLVSASRMFGRHPITTGSHTLIWAIALGFKTIFLLGADCNYVEVVAGAEHVGDGVLRIARDAANPNYFFKDYQKVGDTYHVPNIGGETHLTSWRVAAAVAAEAGAVVYNLSPTSRIDVFDFASIDDWVAGEPLRILPCEVHRDVLPALSVSVGGKGGLPRQT